MELYADAYAAAAGIALYPGSLNVVLDKPWALPPQRISISADDVGRLVYLVPCQLGDRRCFIFRTHRAEQAGGEEHRILEILSDVFLRGDLGLHDGDTLMIVVEDRTGT